MLHRMTAFRSWATVLQRRFSSVHPLTVLPMPLWKDCSLLLLNSSGSILCMLLLTCCRLNAFHRSHNSVPAHVQQYVVYNTEKCIFEVPGTLYEWIKSTDIIRFGKIEIIQSDCSDRYTGDLSRLNWSMNFSIKCSDSLWSWNWNKSLDTHHHWWSSTDDGSWGTDSTLYGCYQHMHCARRLWMCLLLLFMLRTGDNKQLGPKVLSKVTAHHNLQLSLMERLTAQPLYKAKQQQLVVHLLKNYRNHPLILKFLSDTFYDAKLKAEASTYLKHVQTLNTLSQRNPRGMHCHNGQRKTPKRSSRFCSME